MLHLDFTYRRVGQGSHARRLEPAPFALLAYLDRYVGKLVSPQEMLAFMYGEREDGGPGNPHGVLKIHLMKIRRALPSGWALVNETGRGVRLVRTELAHG